MDVTSTTQIQTTTSSDFAYNPNSELKSDDFMKLFLTELQYQDPTAPMETKDMLEQTSQLTQLQTNQDLKNSLNSLISKMDISTQFSSISMIGKIADTGNDGFQVSDAQNLKQDIPFDLYFKENYKDAILKITDVNGNVVRKLDLDESEAGIKSFSWDGTDDNGNPVADGVYAVTADYTTENNEKLTTKMGIYPISSVRFENNEAYVKLGDNYLPLSSVKEVSE